jgi:Ca2+-binding EF-hand superfamily protein
MIIRLSTSTARLGAAVTMLLLAGSAQALTFISPMGEPFRSRPGDKAPEEVWFERADANGDGKITRAEFMADAGRFFRTLDVNHNDEIGPEEIEHYEEDIAPEVRTGGFDLPVPGAGAGGGGGHHRGGGGGGGSRRHGGGGGGHSAADEEGTSSSDTPSPAEHYDASSEGGARYSYLDLPEPVAAADTNFDRGVSPREFADAAHQRFDALDLNHDGVLTRDELPHLGGARPGFGAKGKGNGQHRPHGDAGPGSN